MFAKIITVSKDIVNTPLMRQHKAIKLKHPDAILLFRVGDFYETFSDDAIKTSQILGITLTRRANGTAAYIELAGFPYHALDNYLPKLVRAGQRVAICEQLEDPKLATSIVRRGITELVTPGVSLNDNVLEHKENNYLCCVNIQRNAYGISFMDISTGEFFVAEGNSEYIDKLLNTFNPKEILVERSKKKEFDESFGSSFYTYILDDWMFTPQTAFERLLKQFDTVSLKGFGVENLANANASAGAILHYLDITQHHQTKHITKLSRIAEENYVWLDKFTIRNLEIFQPINENGQSLIDVIDRTISPMGGRLLKRWISLPLKILKPIEERLNVVTYFIENQEFKQSIESQIKAIGDLERLISKASLQRVSPREMLQIKHALVAIEPIKDTCTATGNEKLCQIAEQLNPCAILRDRIARELKPDPPAIVSKGNVIADEVSAELDELRKIAYSGKDYLNQLQAKQARITGIASLKIAYNSVFGYYFEVRNTYKNRVPSEWIRKQTLVDAERYINEELKEYESKILGAEEKILAIETKIFNELVLSASDYVPAIQLNASLVAQLDCLLSFAIVATENKYVRPCVNESEVIDIKEGRHPVIEKRLPIGEDYIPNDIFLDNVEQQVVIITGPNMAGKSALLRQTALIVLMAQIGSYVPAQSADIGYVDKIFTRVGASDNISLGESTFMVEMNEAASILNNLSNRSIILFDELGRGTSTYDGISIAWAIVEYIHEQPQYRPKTLFATHYHELNEMENSFSRIKNYNVSVKEVFEGEKDPNKPNAGRIIFLRKLVRGGSEHSFGIHVARMAGMPKSVVNRANEILKDLEQSHEQKTPSKPVSDIAKHREGYQLSFYQLDDPVLKQIRDEIKSLDINNLTPLDALNKLSQIKKIVIK